MELVVDIKTNIVRSVSEKALETYVLLQSGAKLLIRAASFCCSIPLSR
jgi:hypothetical protein